VSYLIKGDSDASNNAASYIRKKYGIELSIPIAVQFEREFNCILDFGDMPIDGYIAPDWIQFETEQEMALFLLRFT
jgi:hypothetical protein